MMIVAACAPTEATGSAPVTAASAAPRASPSSRVEAAAPSSPSESSAVLRRTPTEREPLRAVVYGDSVALTLSPAIEAGLDTIPATTDLAVWNGFGLTGDHPGRYDGDEVESAFPDWRSDLDDLVESSDPDLFVVLLGAWDIVDREVDEQWRSPGSPEWHEWYEGIVADAVDRMAARGAFVIWLGMPCIHTVNADRVDDVNEVFRAIANRRPRDVAYVDLQSAVCPNGSYRQALPDADGEPQLVRADDGIHFSIYTVAPALGPWFADAFEDLWNVKP